jgi:hypothetical protein
MSRETQTQLSEIIVHSRNEMMTRERSEAGPSKSSRKTGDAFKATAIDHSAISPYEQLR